MAAYDNPRTLKIRASLERLTVTAEHRLHDVPHPFSQRAPRSANIGGIGPLITGLLRPDRRHPAGMHLIRLFEAGRARRGHRSLAQVERVKYLQLRAIGMLHKAQRPARAAARIRHMAGRLAERAFGESP